MAVQNKGFHPETAWAMSLSDLLLVVTPLEDSSKNADDAVSWSIIVAGIEERLNLMKQLTIDELLELEQFKYRYC